MKINKNQIKATSPVLPLHFELLSPKTPLLSSNSPNITTSSLLPTSSIAFPSPKHSTVSSKARRFLLTPRSTVSSLRAQIISILNERTPRKRAYQFNSSQIPGSASHNKHNPSLLFPKNRSNSDMSTSAMLKQNLSIEMSHNFIKGTSETSRKMPLSFINFTQITNKIINDFTAVNKPESIEVSKYHQSFNSFRKNYNQTLHFIEQNRYNIVQQGRKAEKFFYDLKSGGSYIDKANPYNRSSKKRQLKSSQSQRQLSSMPSTLPFKPREEVLTISISPRMKDKVYSKERINRKGLDKSIKIIALNKVKYDEENDDLIVNSIDKLKQIVKESSEEVRSRIKEFTPMFMKHNFKSKTIQRFKSASGNYFGVP